MAKPDDGDVKGQKLLEVRRIALKAISKVSFGCIALALMLPPAAFAENHSVITAIASVNAAFGQTASADEAARRREAEKWLRQARQALEGGRPDVADYCVDRAEKLNANFDSVLSRFADTPAKVRRDIVAARATGNSQPHVPSQQFAPATPAASYQSVPVNNSGTASNPEQALNQITSTTKAQAAEYLNRGRQALQQGDKTAAALLVSTSGSERCGLRTR